MHKNQTIYRLPLFHSDLIVERQKVTSIRYYAIEPPPVRHMSVRDDDASVRSLSYCFSYFFIPVRVIREGGW